MRSYCVILIVLFLLSAPCLAQTADTLSSGIENLPSNYYSKVEKKYASIDKNLSRKSIKYLRKLQRQEEKLNKKLHLPDSTAITLNTDVADKYTSFIKSLSEKGKASDVKLDQYNAYIDSLSTSLSFLKKFGDASAKTGPPIAALDNLKDKLNQSEQVSRFISERKQQVQQLLSNYTKVPASVKKEFDKLNKTAYYYKAQVSEYKSMLKDPKKIEEKALGILNKMPFFQKFMKENSQLASLFGMPGNYGSAASLGGLQTRASVQGTIQQRIAAGGPNAMAAVQQNLQNAQAQLTELKDKLLKSSGIGGISDETDMPDFKPNSQKIKPFLKRLQYSANVQFAKSSNLLPSAANIGLGIGYKLDDKKVIGIGADYSMGMGTIQHLSFTSLGLGLRNYFEWKIKKQIYATGGYEMNYNNAFKNIEPLKEYNAWQRSALIGLSKKYNISKKVKGNMQFLYDFLANRHVPVSQPFLFRVGYNF